MQELNATFAFIWSFRTLLHSDSSMLGSFSVKSQYLINCRGVVASGIRDLDSSWGWVLESNAREANMQRFQAVGSWLEIGVEVPTYCFLYPCFCREEQGQRKRQGKSMIWDTLAFVPDDMRYSGSGVVYLQRDSMGWGTLSISRGFVGNALSEVRKSWAFFFFAGLPCHERRRSTYIGISS